MDHPALNTCGVKAEVYDTMRLQARNFMTGKKTMVTQGQKLCEDPNDATSFLVGILEVQESDV